MNAAVFAFIAFFLLFLLIFVTVFARLFQLWLQCSLSGAPVSLPNILLMQMRKSPARLICEQRIKARHAGIELTTSQLERAHLQGADIEKMVDAMLLAFRTDRNVSWEQLIETELGANP